MIAGLLFYGLLTVTMRKIDWKISTLFGVLLIVLFMFLNRIIDGAFFGLATLAGLCH